MAEQPARTRRPLGARSRRHGRRRDESPLPILLLLVVLIALGLRLDNAARTSFHLDDFHSLYHSGAASFGAFLDGLRLDNHPPLSFALIRLSANLFGDADTARRLPAILAGVAAVVLTWRLARHFTGRHGRIVAAAFVALSSLHIEVSCDARMYALLALTVVGLLDAMVDELEEGHGVARACAWIVVGLHTHYHFLHVLVLLGATTTILAVARPSYRRAARRLALGAGIAGALALPWYLWGFSAQLQHELAPGGAEVSVQKVAEATIHLLFHRVSLSSALGRWILLALGTATVLLALTSLWRKHSSDRARGPAATTILLAVTAFLLPAWTAAAAWISPRAGFEWRYLAGSIAPFAILVGAQVEAGGRLSALRRVATLAALVGALWLACLVVVDPGRENYRGGIAMILAEAEPGDAVLAVDWQPRLFPHGGAWSYYAPRLAKEPLPTALEHTDDFLLAPDTDLVAHDRVFVILRSIPNSVPLLQSLRAAYPTEEAQLFGEAIWVLTFRR